MIKAQYSDPKFQDHGFFNHLHHVLFDAGVVPNTQLPLFELYKLDKFENLAGMGDKGGKPRNLALFRKVVPGNTSLTSGKWDLIRMWQEGLDYNDASSGGSVVINPVNGNVHVLLAFGKSNDAGVTQWQEWEDIIPRSAFAVPIERLPGVATGTDQSAAVAALQRALEGQALTLAALERALGNISQETGALDPKDREILNRYRRLHGLD